MDWASRGIRKRIKETVAVRDALTAGFGRTATSAEVATAMGVPKDVVIEALGDAARTLTTLDEPSARDVAAEIPLPEESALVGERREVLEQAVAALPERMRRNVLAVYFDERPVKEDRRGAGGDALRGVAAAFGGDPTPARRPGSILRRGVDTGLPRPGSPSPPRGVLHPDRRGRRFPDRRRLPRIGRPSEPIPRANG